MFTSKFTARPLGHGGGDEVLRDELVDRVGDRVADHAPDDWSTSRPSSTCWPHAVERRALVVHDLVVLQEVLAAEEVPLLDLLLAPEDALADALVLDGHALFHAKPAEDLDRPLAGEHGHEVVFEGDVEA
jgi:hypothetical protein